MIIRGYFNGLSQDVDLTVNAVNDYYVAELVIPSKMVPIRGKGKNHFEAILKVREQIEDDGWLLGINASRIDASDPGVSEEYNADQVLILTSKGERHFLTATQPASLEAISSIYSQKEHYRQVRELIHNNEQKNPPPLKEKEVVETKIAMPRATWGIVYAFASYFFVSVLIFLFIPVGEPRLIGVAVLANFLFWSFSVVKCVADIAYNISEASQRGLFMLLAQPVVFALLLIFMIGANAYEPGLDLQEMFPSGHLVVNVPELDVE